jgi:hypothetical protein
MSNTINISWNNYRRRHPVALHANKRLFEVREPELRCFVRQRGLLKDGLNTMTRRKEDKEEKLRHERILKKN